MWCTGRSATRSSSLRRCTSPRRCCSGTSRKIAGNAATQVRPLKEGIWRRHSHGTRWLAVVVSLLLIGSAGCKKARGDQEAIRQSVERHLQGNQSLNLSAMDMSFQQIRVEGDKAEADVQFLLKQGGVTMQMAYFLERHGGDWVVVKSQPMDGQFAHPPMEETHSNMAPSGEVHSALPRIDDFFKGAPPPPPDANPPEQPTRSSPNKKSP